MNIEMKPLHYRQCKISPVTRQCVVASRVASNVAPSLNFPFNSAITRIDQKRKLLKFWREW